MAALHDFACPMPACGRVFEDVSEWNPNTGEVDPRDCPACGALSGRIWLKAPGFEGEENVPIEERRAAERQLGIKVETRSQLKRELARLGKVAVTHDEFDRGNSSVNTRSVLSGQYTAGTTASPLAFQVRPIALALAPSCCRSSSLASVASISSTTSRGRIRAARGW